MNLQRLQDLALAASKMQITSLVSDIDEAANKIQNIYATEYQWVSTQVPVPAPVVGALHMRESSFDFTCHLANGDPLTADTVHVPAHIMAPLPPPYFWRGAAVRALQNHIKSWGFNMDTWVWDAAHTLYFCQAYNGFGGPLEYTGYLFSGTDQYVKGKYGKDGVWNKDEIDLEPGIVPILKRLTFLSTAV